MLFFLLFGFRVRKKVYVEKKMRKNKDA